MKRNARNAPGASKESQADPEAPGVLPNPKRIGRIDPSRPLPNARHEAFAQGLAQGMTADGAYKAAGFAENRGNATRLKANESIMKRVDVIQAEANAVSVIKKERAMEYLASVVLTPIGEVHEGSILAQEVTRRTTDFGTETRIKMPGKLEALKILGTWCGWEKGTEAERDAAKALGGVSELIARIRARK